MKEPLVESKTVAEINLELTGSQFPPVFTETTPKVERNKIK